MMTSGLLFGVMIALTVGIEDQDVHLTLEQRVAALEARLLHVERQKSPEATFIRDEEYDTAAFTAFLWRFWLLLGVEFIVLRLCARLALGEWSLFLGLGIPSSLAFLFLFIYWVFSLMERQSFVEAGLVVSSVTALPAFLILRLNA